MIFELEVENFLPFRGTSRVEFPESLTAVAAEYEGEPLRSNRAGKSALAVDAVTFLLFGEVRGVTLAQAVHGDAAEARVRGVVEDLTGARRTVERRVTRKGEQSIRLDDREGGTREYQAQIVAEITGQTYEEYVMTTCFLQGDIHQFMDKTAGEKQALLLSWLGMDRWAPREARAKGNLKTAEDAVQLAERTRAGVAETAAALPEREEALAAAEVAVSEARTGRTDAAAYVEQCAADLATAKDASAVLRDLEEKRKELTRAETALRKAETRAAEIQEIDEQLLEAEMTRGDAERARTALEEAQTVQTERAAALREVQRKLSGTDKLTGLCPVLSEPCDRVKPGSGLVQLKTDLTRLTQENKGASFAVSEARSRSLTADRNVEALVRLEGRRRALGDEETRDGPVETHRTTVSQRRRSVEIAEKKVGQGAAARIAEAEETLSEARGILGQWDEALSEATEKLGAARTARDEALRAGTRLPELDAAVEEAKRHAADWQYVAFLFGRSGLPARELELAFAETADEINYLLSELRLPVRLDLRPDRELKDWEPRCPVCGFAYPKGYRRGDCEGCGAPRAKRRKDELTFALLEGDRESSFELDSGAGKTLISFALRFALSRLRARRTGVLPTRLILDEVYAPLDPVNSDALTHVLRNVLPRLGVRQVWLISHTPASDEIESQVRVLRRRGGYSEVVQ